ncbi:MAG: hypothetical protein IJ373_00025, partial [Clostridia bacterium]|nr:hypothetical protein [Clostridia bacterium]
WDANGNTFAAQYVSGFEANTIYTIRVCFVEGETLKYLHFGTGTTQTYYISSARWGKFDVQNDVYTNATGALLAKYEGDVTALGFDEGSTVTQVSLAGDAWNNRAGMNANIKYDYVDVEWSFTGDRTVYSLCVWAYGTSAAILSGNYTVTVNGGTPANNASERKIQIFDTEYNAVTALAKDTVYILRVYLNGDTSTFAVSTFDTTVDVPAILNFGDITYGNAYDLDETTGISLADGTFTLPENVSGNVDFIKINSVDVYNKATGIGSIDGNVVTPDATALASLTVGTTYEMKILTDDGWYNANAIVATDVITTTQELRDLGVGGKVYTDRTPTYNNSVGAVAAAGGNGNSGVTGNDVTGYYILGNDLDFAGENAVAAGYAFQQSWFKATFDGNGYTIFNLSVNEGGIFGSMRNATVKNVNFVGLVYDMSLGLYAGQYSQQTALFAHVCDSSTIENVNVHVTNVKTSSFTWATIVYNFWNTNTVTNVNVDASGMALSNVLGKDSQSKVTYDNVTIKAASYATMGQLGSTDLTEWPTGVTFETVADQPVWQMHNGTTLSLYTGDEADLGFAEGTPVYESVQDVRTNMWNAGTNGFTMEQQALKIYKAAD